MRKASMGAIGVFCRLFGSTPRNKIIELFLEARESDFSVSDIADQTGMVRMTTHNNVQKLVKERVLRQSRVVGGTQLYVLNVASPIVRAYLTTFDQVLLPHVEAHHRPDALN